MCLYETRYRTYNSIILKCIFIAKTYDTLDMKTQNGGRATRRSLFSNVQKIYFKFQTWVEEGGVGGRQQGGGEGAAAARIGKRCVGAHAQKLPGCHRQCRCQQVANKFERLAKALAVEWSAHNNMVSQLNVNTGAYTHIMGRRRKNKSSFYWPLFSLQLMANWTNAHYQRARTVAFAAGRQFLPLVRLRSTMRPLRYPPP
jgi:hypothetical protein